VKSLGVFDIGSNTILMTLGRLAPSGEIEVLFDVGDVARLAEGLQDGHPLHAAAKARALQTLGHFRELARPPPSEGPATEPPSPKKSKLNGESRSASSAATRKPRTPTPARPMISEKRENL
jgi:hypothetical protein